MSKRITTIVGAGAVLDFDYSYPEAVFPSTKNITESVCNITVQGLDVEQSDIICKLYHLAGNALTDIYKDRDIKNHRYELNFEELYFLIESMLSLGSDGIEYLDPHGCPPLSLLVKEVDELNHYSHVEYVRALYAIVKKIICIIDKYNAHFRNVIDSESWYREFWQGDDKHKFDVFTFNYDTTIEQSMGIYEDGFLPLGGNSRNISYFNPKRLLRNPNKYSTVQHLHGCIYYSECAPYECAKTHSNRDMFKMKSVQEAVHQIGVQSKDQSQDKTLFLNSPILIGLRKLDKMTCMPSSIYHADLVNKLLRNRGVLIVGYSFGDLYVNQLLQRRLLMQGDKHRMVIIEKFPRYIYSPTTLYRYISDNCTKLKSFLRPFMDIHFDNFQLRGFDFSSYYEPIYSEDRKCILFICGFKHAIENYKDLILRFL